MTPAARVSAAIEVLADIVTRRRPAADALKDWGIAHRFAGSGDRAAIAGLTYDALRRRASAGFVMDSDTPRAVMLGMLRLERNLDAAAITQLADGSRHAPSPLTNEERSRLEAASLEGALPWVAGDYPEWLDPHFARTFGDERGGGGCRAIVARAARSAGQHAQGYARGGCARARRSCAYTDALVAGRACASRCPPTPRVRRSTPSLPSSRDWSRCRTKARSFCLAGGGEAWRAGGRSLCRRRRQDAGARRGHGEPRAALRHRYGQAPAGADPCAVGAGRRA